MKISYFSDYFFPTITGIATAIANLSSGLADRGHEITIFAPKYPVNTYKPHNESIEIHYIPSIPSGVPETRLTAPLYQSILKLVKEFDPDIIHIESTFIVGVLGLIIAKVLKKRVVGNFHGYISFSNIGIPQIEFINTLTVRWTSFLLNFCDFAICPAKLGVTELKTQGLKKPVHFVPNSINENMIKKLDQDAVTSLKKKYNLKKNTVIFVGRMVMEKKIDQLIKSMVAVVKEVPDTTLFLVGDGKYRADFELLVKKLQLTDYVVFAGEISQQDLLTKGFYQVGDVFATASTTELQPVSLSEAMYFALPLIGANEKGVEEMVRNVGISFQAGNISELSKDIIDVLKNPTLRRKLSAASLETYNTVYSYKAILDKYELLYKSIS